MATLGIKGLSLFISFVGLTGSEMTLYDRGTGRNMELLYHYRTVHSFTRRHATKTNVVLQCRLLTRVLASTLTVPLPCRVDG